MKEKKIGFLVAGLLLGTLLMAQDAQWRGPGRDGKYPGTGLLKQWPEGGPELIFELGGLGNGYSTPVLYKDHVYITGRRDSLELIARVDLQGKLIWEVEYGRAWLKSFPESRGTPCIEDDRIYLMDGQGAVSCIDAIGGELLWAVNPHRDYGGEFHRWGTAESLLLHGDAVITSPIGEQTSMVALNKDDGSLIWKSDAVEGVRSYVSPLLIEFEGRELILMNSSEMLYAVDPSDGVLVWEKNIVEGFTGERNRRNNTNTPLYQDGMVYTSAGYDATSLMFRLTGGGNDAELLWKNDTLDNHHGGLVLVDGFIYGANWENNGNGNWVCQDWESGRIMWEEKWINKGSVIFADGMLYLFEEKRGNLGLAEASPEGFRLVSSFTLEGDSGPYWAHPSIYDGKLLVRHGRKLFVYNIAAD